MLENSKARGDTEQGYGNCQGQFIKLSKRHPTYSGSNLAQSYPLLMCPGSELARSYLRFAILTCLTSWRDPVALFAARSSYAVDTAI